MGWFDADGTVKQAIQQGRPQRYKKDVEKKNVEKQICLNCKKPKCRGCSEKFKKKYRESENSNG